MPLYLFSLPDDLASPEASEELANDAEARQVAQIVANELSRNRYDGEEIAVLVFNDSGQLIHKVCRHWQQRRRTLPRKLRRPVLKPA